MVCMAISKEDIKPLAWSADDEPTFLKDDEKKDGKNGNVAGSVDTVLRARRTFKMKKGSGGRKKQSWKALNTRWVRARDEMFVNERFLEKVLQVMGRMRFGVKNSMLIALQNEKATRIATAASWRGLGVQLLPGAEAKPIWLDAGADTQRKTIVPSKWYDITQTDAGEKLTLKGTIYNTLAICRITLNQIDELKIVEQQGVTGIHYDREAVRTLCSRGRWKELCFATPRLKHWPKKILRWFFRRMRKQRCRIHRQMRSLQNVQRILYAYILAFCRRKCVCASRRRSAQIKLKICCERYPQRRASQHKKLW